MRYQRGCVLVPGVEFDNSAVDHSLRVSELSTELDRRVSTLSLSLSRAFDLSDAARTNEGAPFWSSLHARYSETLGGLGHVEGLSPKREARCRVRVPGFVYLVVLL